MEGITGCLLKGLSQLFGSTQLLATFLIKVCTSYTVTRMRCHQMVVQRSPIDIPNLDIKYDNSTAYEQIFMLKMKKKKQFFKSVAKTTNMIGG